MRINRKLLLYTSATVLLSFAVAGGASQSATAQKGKGQSTTVQKGTGPAAAPAPRTDESEQAARLRAATTALEEIMSIPDKAIPQDLLDRAECVAVVPGLKKGAFIVGAQYGKGYFSCRAAENRGWTAPGTIRMEGGSFGFQIGGQENDIIMLIMNPQGRDRLLSNQFKIGGDASAAAGPVGRTAAASTDLYLTAQILTWARSRGLFAGVSLDGTTVRQDIDDNEALYGRPLTNRDIIFSGVEIPAAARPFVDLLNKYSPREKS